MGIIIRLADHGAKDAEKGLTGAILAPAGMDVSVLSGAIQHRINALIEGADANSGNFAKLSAAQEIRFLESLSKRLAHD